VGLEFAQVFRRFGARSRFWGVSNGIRDILGTEGIKVALNAECIEVFGTGGKREMKRVGRGDEKSETQGFMKIMMDAESEQILGAAILGTEGDEAIHGILDTMYAKAPYTVLQRAAHIHPTVSEPIPTVLGQLQPLC
jgi:pyruvate/2-oxoglutarate dehydrogenase complex dihydrolipoamide dehydrogenase (E3) component